jgi:hypothetical protein
VPIRAMPAFGSGIRPDAADSLLPATPADAHTKVGSVTTEDMDRARGASSNGNGGGRPPFLRI